MTVLEGYSARETALLLHRTPESVRKLRIEALQRLAELDPEIIVTVHTHESRVRPDPVYPRLTANSVLTIQGAMRSLSDEAFAWLHIMSGSSE